MFVWEDGYKIGQEEMDAEHLVLFALLNQLDININDDRAGDCLNDVLNALGAYIHYHFAHEEELMRAWNYPNLAAHAVVHQEFINKLSSLREQMGGDALKAALKVRSFVLDWLLGHILETDVEYVTFMATAAPPK